MKFKKILLSFILASFAFTSTAFASPVIDNFMYNDSVSTRLQSPTGDYFSIGDCLTAEGLDSELDELICGDAEIQGFLFAPNMVDKTIADMDIYIATTGTDNDTCGIVASPCKTRQYVYDNILPSFIDHKVVIYLAAGTYYDNAILKGKIIGEGSLKIMGHVIAIDDNGGAHFTATGGDDENADGRGEFVVAAAGWTPSDFAGKWLRVIESNSATAAIYEKYYPIKDNTADTITTTIVAFTPTATVTKFDVVDFDTFILGSTPDKPISPKNIVEIVDNIITSITSDSLDGLYYIQPLMYEALNIGESHGSGISINNSNILLSGIGFNKDTTELSTVVGDQAGVTQIVVDDTSNLRTGMLTTIGTNLYQSIQTIDDATHFTISGGAISVLNGDKITYYATKGIYSSSSNVLAYGIKTSGHVNGIATSANFSSVTIAGVNADFTDQYYDEKVYAAQALTNSVIYLQNYDVYGDGGDYINSLMYAYGAGTYAYLWKGRVDYVNRLTLAGGTGYAAQVATNAVYGSNINYFAKGIAGGFTLLTDQANITSAVSDYDIDDTSHATIYDSGDYVDINGKIDDDALAAASATILSNFRSKRLTSTAPYTMTSTPTVVAGLFEGQSLTLIGTSNEITLQDNAKLAGSLLSLKSDKDAVLGKGHWIEFVWLDIDGTYMWSEQSRFTNDIPFDANISAKNITSTASGEATAVTPEYSSGNVQLNVSAWDTDEAVAKTTGRGIRADGISGDSISSYFMMYNDVGDTLKIEETSSGAESWITFEGQSYGINLTSGGNSTPSPMLVHSGDAFGGDFAGGDTYLWGSAGSGTGADGNVHLGYDYENSVAQGSTYVHGLFDVTDETARTTSLVNVQAGSVATPVVTDQVAAHQSTLYSSGYGAPYLSNMYSVGTAAYSGVAGYLAVITPHASDAADSMIAGFQPFLTSDVGSATKSAVSLLEYSFGLGIMWDYVISSEVGANMRLLEPVDDANPNQIYGASEAESLIITENYKSGTQSLENVTLETKTDLVDADAGQYIFKVNEAEKLRIKDSGIKVVGGFTANITEVTSATYNILSTDYFISNQYTDTGAAAVTLPAISTSNHGQVYIIKDSDYNASGNTLTINKTGADTIDEAATATVTSDGASLSFMANNTTKNWEIF